MTENKGDLISREALKKKLQEHHDFFVNAWGGFKNLSPNDKARVDEITHCISEVVNAPTVEDNEPTLNESIAFNNGYELGKSERPQVEWIPIKMRPGTDEEFEEFSQYGDCLREDFRVFECPLPDDEQKVLVTTRWGDVCVDIWHRDVDCCYFEDNSDDDDVIAWMPLPEPYKKGGAE